MKKKTKYQSMQEVVDTSGLRFPSTWRLESQYWASLRDLSQAQIDSDEVWLVEWREKRDRLQQREETSHA